MKIKSSVFLIVGAAFIIALFLLSGRSPVFSEEINCLMCHEALSKEKSVHAAIQMGCPTCHSAIDAKDMPHKKTNKSAKGLSSEQPDLCYGCHDKAKFTMKTVHAAIGMGCTGCHNPHSSKNAKLLISGQPDLCFNCHDKAKFTMKTVHPAISMGCTGCHNPHSSNNEKLLISAPPDLCFNCHDKAQFSKKNVHMPVAGGMCLSCHASIHSSKEPALFGKEIKTVCVECHPAVAKSPHIRMVRKEGHPLSGDRDYARKDKPFSCASCHNPHSSDNAKLFRYKANNAFDLCNYCHKS